MITLTLLDLINLTSSLAAIILSVLAIALSMVFFLSSKRSEKNIAIAINKIEEATGTLSNISLKMINKLTTAIITPSLSDEKRLSDILKEVKQNGLLVETDEKNEPTKAELEQFRFDNLIAALYYSALANISTQYFLPETLGQTDNNTGIADIIDQSKNDFEILKNWILGAKDAESKLTKSPVHHMYDMAMQLDSDVKSTREYYVAKENQLVPNQGSNSN